MVQTKQGTSRPSRASSGFMLKTPITFWYCVGPCRVVAWWRAKEKRRGSSFNFRSQKTHVSPPRQLLAPLDYTSRLSVVNLVVHR